MITISIDWYNAEDAYALHDAAEIDHPSYPETLCPWIEKLRKCPDGRWVHSVDVPDMGDLDENGFPRRPRSLAFGIVYSREEAVAAVKDAIERIIGGVAVVP